MPFYKGHALHIFLMAGWLFTRNGLSAVLRSRDAASATAFLAYWLATCTELLKFDLLVLMSERRKLYSQYKSTHLRSVSYAIIVPM
jgi:hypothetical protein